MNVWRLDTLVVFVRLTATSRLPLCELRIDPCLVIGLSQLYALDWLVCGRLSLRESLISTAS